ncbi:MAG: alpha/beta hydrolase family protein [Acidimicrobiales bacterium]
MAEHGRDTTRRGGWSYALREPVREPLDVVTRVPAGGGGSTLPLHMVFTDDGTYVPAIVLAPEGAGPFPAVICLHGGSGGLGVSYLADQVLHRGMVYDRLLQEGYLVCVTEGRMEHEDAYGSPHGEHVLDHEDVVAVFNHLAGQPAVDPLRIGFFGVSHGGEEQMKVVSELGGGPAALVPTEPAVIEYLGLRYPGERTEAQLQFNGDLDDELVDLEGAMRRIERIPAGLPILVVGRDGDHLQGLFRKLYELLDRAGRNASWASFDHPEHAYQWGPRLGEGGYRPGEVERATLERVVGFLNREVRDRSARPGPTG